MKHLMIILLMIAFIYGDNLDAKDEVLKKKFGSVAKGELL